MLKFYTLPYLCCNATSPRVKIWATSSCVGQSPAATQPKTPHSSPIPDSSNSIFIGLSVNLTDRGSSVSAISACPCVSALRQQGSNTCHSKWRSLKLNKLNWNRLSCCKKKKKNASHNCRMSPTLTAIVCPNPRTTRDVLRKQYRQKSTDSHQLLFDLSW